MSSETSTEPQPTFEPWQLFTLAGLIGATIAVFMARGESPGAVIMISLTIFAAAVVGIAALRTFLPLTQKSATFGPRLLGGRTRAALEREKTLVLRSIKELEFDHAMGKVSEKDFADMGARLRARATRLMRQLDAGAGYRSEIEKEITKRIGAAPPVAGSQEQARGGSKEQEPPSVAGACPSCGTSNDTDARFCKHCGHSIEARS
jgi:zinc ribbon protein